MTGSTELRHDESTYRAPRLDDCMAHEPAICGDGIGEGLHLPPIPEALNTHATEGSKSRDRTRLGRYGSGQGVEAG